MDWAENLNIAETSKLVMDRNFSPLCGIPINNSFAFGMKDGTLMIMSEDGKIRSVLKEHKASICTLAILNMKGSEYLATGSDHGCSSIIIWNPSNWTVIQKFDNHSAAVTAILDLKDDCHFLSGGYDKKINIYSL